MFQIFFIFYHAGNFFSYFPKLNLKEIPEEINPFEHLKINDFLIDLLLYPIQISKI